MKEEKNALQYIVLGGIDNLICDGIFTNKSLTWNELKTAGVMPKLLNLLNAIEAIGEPEAGYGDYDDTQNCGDIGDLAYDWGRWDLAKSLIAILEQDTPRDEK